MRNIGMRINASNIITLVGSGPDEIIKARHVLCRAMGVSVQPGENLEGRMTPSELRVLGGLLEWYGSNAREEVRFRASPAYVYANLNTGINLVFLMNSDYDPISGVEIALVEDTDIVSNLLVPDDFD